MCSLMFDLHCPVWWNIVDKGNHESATILVIFMWLKYVIGLFGALRDRFVAYLQMLSIRRSLQLFLSVQGSLSIPVLSRVKIIHWNQLAKQDPLMTKTGWLVSFVYLWSLPVAHLSDAPRRRLVVTGNSARIQDETTENSTWFFNMVDV